MAAVCCVGEAGEAGERSRVALVTGATGFVGGHLVRRLRADGWTVFSVVRRASDDPSAHHHDGTTESLSRIVTSVRPDVVFHLASRFVAEHGESDVESLVRDNILFGAQLLETLQAAGCSALVNVGSAWQHFGNAEYSPTSLYAATKQAFLDIAEYYVAAQGLRMVTVEFTDTYGPADTRRKLIPVMLGAERSGTELQMVGDEMMLDFVHVSDAVEALMMAAERVRAASGAGSERFAVRSGTPVSPRALFDAWERARGTRIAARFGARPYRQREMLAPWTQGDVLPGWRPAVSLEAGLRDL